MAAGLGFKTFTTGEVLTAGDVNGYLMQGVLVFASEAARNAAITSPQEGQFAYTKDNNSLWYYTGSAWAASGATGDIEGVTAGVGITGGGTSGTVTITNDMATTITAAGDIVVGTGSGTYDNLPIGTTAQVLTADTTVSPYKVKWATPATGGTANWSLLNAGGTALTGAQTITVSGISGANQVMIVFVSASNGQAGTALGIRLNTDTGSNYNSYGTYVYSPAAYVTGGISQNITTTNGTYIGIGNLSGSVGSAGSGYCLISGTNAAGVKPFQAVSGFSRDANDSQQNNIIGGLYSGTSTISSISMYSPSSNFDAGTVYVYTTA
jgi:hypothetical protein